MRGSEKMDYKAKFKPLEVYAGGAWRDLDSDVPAAARDHPLDRDPIQDQVAAIVLPEH